MRTLRVRETPVPGWLHGPGLSKSIPCTIGLSKTIRERSTQRLPSVKFCHHAPNAVQKFETSLLVLLAAPRPSRSRQPAPFAVRLCSKRQLRDGICRVTSLRGKNAVSLSWNVRHQSYRDNDQHNRRQRTRFPKETPPYKFNLCFEKLPVAP